MILAVLLLLSIQLLLLLLSVVVLRRVGTRLLGLMHAMHVVDGSTAQRLKQVGQPSATLSNNCPVDVTCECSSGVLLTSFSDTNNAMRTRQPGTAARAHWGQNFPRAKLVNASQVKVLGLLCHNIGQDVASRAPQIRLRTEATCNARSAPEELILFLPINNRDDTWLAAVAAAPPICAFRATALSTALREVALGLRSPPASRIAATSRIACRCALTAHLSPLTSTMQG